MNRETKKVLIKRKFSSVEYMKELESVHGEAVETLKEAIKQFYRFPPQSEDWHLWDKSDWPETWEGRVLKNLERTQANIGEAIKSFGVGDVSPIRSVAGSVQNVFRNMDVMGWKWWGYVPVYLKNEFNDKLVKASDIGANIARELSNHWRKPDSVLDEEITGPIDEEDLKRFLKPGES